MPTDDELIDFLAGKIPLKDAEKIDQHVRDSASLETQVANLPTDPLAARLRKVWKRQHPDNGEPQNGQSEASNDEAFKIDRYCLLELIGTGGMGQVWKAKAVHSVSPNVALKLIKPGLDSGSVIERFELERKALAMMDHPCIAKVLDGGATEDNQSYFVMELVDGPSITDYCEQHQLGIDQRLKLFVQVCRAVQHAHQKGVIHRDLKPSNILVTQYDGHALPKVIDFGLAKALSELTGAKDQSQLTEHGALVGTVRYMSPEQVASNLWDIDTRSDIYSLGIVLYELLTGSTPIQGPADGEHSLLSILQSIRETDPPKPSERLKISLLAGSGEQSARYRVARQILRRDLDWIVMKAIDKNRDRRYQTADAFAQDIDRYLTGQAVSARPPSAFYRLSKFVKKNRSQVAVTIMLLLMIMAGIASLIKNSQVDREKRAVYAASSYSSIINELNLLSVNRRSGWTHRGLGLIEQASTIATPLRDPRQLRDWAASLLTIPDVDMKVYKQFAARVSPTDMTYAPSGRRLAVGLATTDDRPATTIVLVDLDTDQQQWLTPDIGPMVNEIGGDPSVTSLRFGQDDNTLYVGTRNGILLRMSLDQSPPVIKSVRASRGGVLARLSSDGRYCVTVTSRQQKLPGEHDERMRCFDATTLEQLGESEANERATSLSIAPDGSRISASWDIPLGDPPFSTEYSLPTFKPLRTFPGYNAEYHPLGHAVFTGDSATFKRIHREKPYETSTYLPGTTLAWKPHRIPTFQYFQVCQGGTILTASSQADNCIFFWREAESMPFMSFRVSENRNINGYAVSPTLESIAVITDEALEIYNITAREQYRRVKSLPARTDYFAIAADQSQLAIIAGDTFLRYQLPAMRRLDSRTAACSSLAHNTLAYQSTSHRFAFTRVAVRQSVELFISGDDSAIPELTFLVHDQPEERFSPLKVAGLGWINEDHLVAAIDFRLLVWNTNSGQLEMSTPEHNPDRMLPSYVAIACGRNRCVTLNEEGALDRWEWSGDKLTKCQPTIELKTSKAERLAWHPHGDYAIVGTQSGSIQFIDLKSGQSLLANRDVHSGEISGAAWCNAERLVTASRDGKLALWRLRDGELKPYVAWDTRSGITAIVVSADGKLCYVASASESISVFDLDALDAQFTKLGIDGE